MSPTLLNLPATITPTSADTELAKISGRQLAKLGKPGRGKVSLSVKTDGSEESVAIPRSALKLLTEILNQMALGNAVTLIPVHAELTTQEAADLLNVSRPFVIKLIGEGKLACRMVGNHRRILFRDLMDYQRQTQAAGARALDDLAAQAQDLKLGY